MESRSDPIAEQLPLALRELETGSRSRELIIGSNISPTLLSKQTVKMLSQTAARLPMTVARRGFHTTRPQLASPYHYPEGPRTNIPFNPMTRFFAVRFWSFMAVGFGAPFAIAVWQTKKNQ